MHRRTSGRNSRIDEVQSGWWKAATNDEALNMCDLSAERTPAIAPSRHHLPDGPNLMALSSLSLLSSSGLALSSPPCISRRDGLERIPIPLALAYLRGLHALFALVLLLSFLPSSAMSGFFSRRKQAPATTRPPKPNTSSADRTRPVPQ